jgi:hypothetical protein
MKSTLTRRRCIHADHSESRMRRNLNTMMMVLWMTITIFCIAPQHTSATSTTITTTPTIATPLFTTEYNNNHHRSRDDATFASSVPQTPTVTSGTIAKEPETQRRQFQENMYHLRRRQQQQQRKLPGNDMMGNIDLMSAEAGFMIGFGFLIVLIFLCLCCCCCRRRPYGYNNNGGGSNCLWDLVAIVCLWEMCCDNDGIMGDGFLSF